MQSSTIRVIFWTAFVTAVLIGVLAFAGGFSCSQKRTAAPLWSEIRTLTTKITEKDSLIAHLKQLKQDTITKWYERPFKKEVAPETVYVYRDTINVDTAWGRWPESIISLDKRGKRLSFTSLIPADSLMERALVKEYIFDRVGNTFSVRSKGEGFYVKTVHPFWTKFHGGVSADAGFKVWGDSTMPFVDPRVRAYVGWGPVSVGPTLTLRGIELTAGIGWTF